MDSEAKNVCLCPVEIDCVGLTSESVSSSVQPVDLVDSGPGPRCIIDCPYPTYIPPGDGPAGDISLLVISKDAPSSMARSP